MAAHQLNFFRLKRHACPNKVVQSFRSVSKQVLEFPKAFNTLQAFKTFFDLQHSAVSVTRAYRLSWIFPGACITKQVLLLQITATLIGTKKSLKIPLELLWQSRTPRLHHKGSRWLQQASRPKLWCCWSHSLPG